MKTYVVTLHYNRLSETVLMMGHKLCSDEEIWLIIPKLPLLPLLIWSTDIKLHSMVYISLVCVFFFCIKRINFSDLSLLCACYSMCLWGGWGKGGLYLF